MKIWRYTWLDAILLMLSIIQFVTMLILAKNWETSLPFRKLGSFALLVFMMVYNIVIISHLFTHTHWFQSQLLNGLVSMLNSINIGQSVQVYHLKHVRNHHRYNNDPKGPDGKTNDLSSTFQDGEGDEHATLFRYAFVGAVSSLLNLGHEMLTVFRLWRVGDHEDALLNLVSKSSPKRANELRQVQLDRIAHFLGVCLFLSISWNWTLTCYLPAFYLALALVNVQNYYEHYGAMPNSRTADSVSYYGRLYNLLTFNDGYHQEHHWSYGAHWSSMPEKHDNMQNGKLNQKEHIISPVPAILGFLHRKRLLIHHSTPLQKRSQQDSTSEQESMSPVTQRCSPE